jgi:hypothetical protein
MEQLWKIAEGYVLNGTDMAVVPRFRTGLGQAALICPNFLPAKCLYRDQNIGMTQDSAAVR